VQSVFFERLEAFLICAGMVRGPELRVGQTAEGYGRNLLGKTYSGRVVEVEEIMGGKTVFTRASSERKDLNVLQVVIGMEPGFSAPVGLQVDVRIRQ
jgi:hypothetical protein